MKEIEEKINQETTNYNQIEVGAKSFPPEKKITFLPGKIPQEQLKKEVNKMYVIRFVLFVSTIIELLLFFYSLKSHRSFYLSCAEIQRKIFRDKYSPHKGKDKYLDNFRRVNWRLNGFSMPVITIDILFLVFFTFTGAIRFSFCGNLDMENQLNKIICYFCCCLKIECLELFHKCYFVLNLGVFVLSLILFNKFQNFYDIDDDLDEELDIVRMIGRKFFFMYFFSIAFILVICYCLDYVKYFLRRTLIYVEYYKLLGENGQLQEANKVRKLLGYITTHNEQENLIELKNF